ncbi:MAG: ribonuclease J [Acidobacteria bacterium]|nr:ribonuclease J [Acidobacteriota bacterium]
MHGVSDAAAAARDLPVELVPLGGLGEFGLNMMAVSCGETTIVIDAGAMFPDSDLPGVDVIVQDLAYLEAKRGQIRALVLTHGHEDHIGAVPYVLPHVQGPVYGPPLALAMVEPKLEEHRVTHTPGLEGVRPGQRVTVGPFTLEFLRVTHSMPDCLAVAIHTPQGVILHTGDFKIDQTPLDREMFDLPRFAELGREGVLALLADSTNVDRPGITGSEREVHDAFEELFTSTEGRLVVATFSSSLYRVQLLVDLAAAYDRKAVFLGRSMERNTQIAQRTGHLHLPTGVVVRDVDIASVAARDLLCITTGSQGEPNATLSRVAIDDHRHLTLGADDRVVLSARAIPGNEKAIGRVMNHLARRGVEVVTEGDRRVHVSGHASSEELKLILSLVRPKYFVPIHGEYRQLARHARIAELVTSGLPTRVQVLLAQDGDRLRFDAEGACVTERVPVGRVYIDSTRVGEVNDEVLRDRRHIASDGIVVPVVAINANSGQVEGVPELVGRGFVTDNDDGDLLADGAAALNDMLARCSAEERGDPGLIQERVRQEVRRYLRKHTGRRPLVLPVVMEI